MAELAAATGGTYFHNSNDLEGGFKRLAEAPEYLYLLAFSIGDVKQNGSYHRLKVKVVSARCGSRDRRCTGGWVTADVYLANAYLQSKGVPLDYDEATHWMKEAAEHGNRQAQVNLGSMYRDGRGTSQDYGEAMYWYRKAADQGSAMAEWMIGRLYFDGKGVIRDFTEAAAWFRKAAREGLPTAQWDLGMIYYRGYGVSKDLGTARAWLQKAAARGYAPANEMLARLDAAGYGRLRAPRAAAINTRTSGRA